MSKNYTYKFKTKMEMYLKSLLTSMLEITQFLV
jgi:hypothetical protein